MRKDAQENRQEILRVARFLIAQQGSDVSLRTIASTAGVGIATLYRNFPTREDLLLGIVQETAEEAEAAIAECLETWDADLSRRGGTMRMPLLDRRSPRLPCVWSKPPA